MTATAVQVRLDEVGYLQLIEAEHGQGQQGKQDAEGADGPDVLEIGLKLLAGGAGNNTHNGISDRRAEDVAQ